MVETRISLADHVELALELVLVRRVRAATDEHLAHEGLGSLGRLAEHGVVGGHGACAEVDLSFGLHHAREHFFDLAALRRVARHEDVAGCVVTRLRQVDARVLLRHLLEERMRHLQQDAGAVAGVDLAAAGAAMVEVLQDLDALLDDGVRFLALDVHDEADAAGVMLELRVIEALLCRRPESNRGHFPVLQTQTRGAHRPHAMGSRPQHSRFSNGYIRRRGREARRAVRYIWRLIIQTDAHRSIIE
jgi:hypothetical protein